MLDVRFQQPIFDDLHEYTTLNEFLDEKRTVVDRDRDSESSCFGYNYDVLTRFQYFHVTVQCSMGDDVLLAGRVLRNLLLRKHVTLTVLSWPWQGGRQVTSTIVAGTQAISWLQATRCLRCVAIEFQGLDKAKTRDLVEVITGKEPFYDTWKHWIDTYHAITDGLPNLEIDLVDDLQDQVFQLEEIAASYDREAYLKKREALFESMLEQMNSMTRAEIKEIKEIMDDANARVEEFEERQTMIEEGLSKVAALAIPIVE